LKSFCWEWTGANNGDGYGKFCKKYVHRIAYEQIIGVIPDGLQIDHLCRNRLCCNPTHLELVTSRENTLRGESIMAQEAKRTHCIHGHELSGSNLIVRKNGNRDCRLCRMYRKRAYRQLA
jgi:hypothetical protein